MIRRRRRRRTTKVIPMMATSNSARYATLKVLSTMTVMMI
jgi:hypothetical protein